MKRAKPVKWICPYKNDITNNLEPQKPVIYSRYQKFLIGDSKTKSLKSIKDLNLLKCISKLINIIVKILT